MYVTISSELLQTIVEEAAGSPGREVCGLLFGDDDRIAAHIPCRNVAADSETAFEVDPVALIDAHRAARAGGPRVIGCYHSHPGGSPVPSQRDAAAAPADGALWLIVGSGRVGLWRAIARGIHHGRFEMVELVAQRRACTAS